jgi:phage-related protein
MAGNITVSIKDRQTAESWLKMVNSINEDYKTAMEEATRTIKDIQTLSDGTIVDDLVGLADSFLNAAEVTFEGINAIADTVLKVLSTVEDFVDEAKGFVQDTLKKLFN